MSIVIGRVANKFWTNADWDCPNGFPIYEEQQELKFDTPNMNDFMSGTIYLEGDSWNHCKYEGAYYSLFIVHSVSHRKKRYLYRLERDLWMDILIHRPKVIGDLSNSNNDELLEANLNRTIPTLDNPARVITVNFGNIDFDGTKEFIFKESRKELKQIVLSKDNFNNFVAAISGEWARDGKYINENLYFGNEKDFDIKKGANEATFIFSYLIPSVTSVGGKHLLREKINEFIRSIEADKGKEFKLSKLNSEAFKTSPINGNYCITHKVDGISTTAESIRLKEIDLSNLTDIIPIKIYDLTEVEPETELGTGAKAGLFEVVDTKIPDPSFLAKIRRKAYIPINASSGVTPNSPARFGSFRETGFNGKKAKEPQVVNGSFGGQGGRFHLGFLDNVNFMVCYDGGNPGEPYSEVAALLESGPFAVFTPKFWWKMSYNDNLRAFKRYSFFKAPKPGVAYYSPFDHLDDPIVPFGFLIYGLQRRYGEWKRFEYIGKATKTSVFYWSGIKNKLLDEYSNPYSQEGWARIDQKLAAIQPTEAFTKFYLDNYHFTWLPFFPTTKFYGGNDPYLNTDGGGTGIHTGYQYWTQKVLNSDLRDIEGRSKRINPYSNERYPAERARVDQNLVTLLNRTTLELPEGMTLEEGDYFFTDQDYEIVEYPKSQVASRRLKPIAQGRKNEYPHIGSRLIPGTFVVEDMLDIKDAKLFAGQPDLRLVVLCTTSDGGSEIRTLETFERELSISSSNDEIVRQVDGATKRNTRFTIIKKLIKEPPAKSPKEEVKGLKEEHKVQVLHAFYKVHGYKTKINKGVAHGTGFDESDFAPGSNTQQLFDLVGTDGYAFVAKGKISLIAKRTDLFAPQKGQSGKLLHEENKELKLSLLEKINQKVRFQFFGVPYYLNWRSLFDDRDRINFKAETISPTELQTNFDQYFLYLDTEFDQVYYENASLAKKQTKALSPADSVQLEKLNLDMAKAQYAYQIDSDKYKMAVDRYNENIKRAETDLYHSRLSSWMNLGAAAGSGAFGTGIALKYREGAKTVTTIGEGATMNPNFSLGFSPGSIPFSGPEGVGYGFESVPMKFKEITKFAGKTPNIMAGVVTGALFKASKLIMDHAFRFPEEARRIGVEKQIGAADLALKSLTLNTKFIEKQLDVQLAINQKTNIYSNPIISEREIMESFMDKEEGHGKKLKPAHLVCFVPSEEQLVALREFKDQYGVMCDIPNVVTHFYEGMPPDVIRYRNLDDDAITGLPNEGMRAFLKSHLLAGVKIRKVTREVYEILDADDYREKILRLNSDLLDKADNIKTLEGRINTIVEETKAECAVEASELQKKITNLENEVNEVNRRLREKLEECKKAGEDDERNKEELHKLKVEKEELEQKLADERRRAINEKDEINRLKKKDEERTELVNKLQEEFNKIQVNLPKVVQELEECKKGEDSRQACALISEIFIDPYEFDLKSRENGGDAFMDLIFELATALRGEGRSRIDQKLGNMEQMRPLLEKLEELKNVPIVDKAIDVMQETGGNKYQDGIKSGGEKNGDIRNVIEKMNQIKLMETPSALHQVKALLDELNFVCYKLIGISHEMVTASQDIQFFLKHVYPGKSLELYQEIFGDYNHAIIRKTYPIACKPGGPFEGVNVSRLLTEAKKGIKLRLEIFDQPSPGQEEEGPKQEEGGSQPSQPEEAKQEEKPQADQEIYFYGMPLSKVNNPDFNGSFSAAFMSDVISSMQDKYFSEHGAGFPDVKVFGAALESYYWRYLKMSKRTSDGFGASNRDGTGSSRQNGGNKYKLAHIGLRIGKTWVSNKYINVAGFKTKRFDEVAGNVMTLLQRLDEITVDEDYYNKVRSGEIRISIRANSVDRNFAFSADTVEIPLDTIKQMDSRNLLKEFIKFLYIFDRNKLEIVDGAYDYSDGWRVAQAYYSSGANIEAHYKNVGATNNDRKDRFAIGFIYSDAPVFFRSIDGSWVYENENYRTTQFLEGKVGPEGVDKNSIPASPRFKIIKFLRYFYAISTGKYITKEHPGGIGSSRPTGKFFEALEAVAKY